MYRVKKGSTYQTCLSMEPITHTNTQQTDLRKTGKRIPINPKGSILQKINSFDGSSKAIVEKKLVFSGALLFAQYCMKENKMDAQQTFRLNRKQENTKNLEISMSVITIERRRIVALGIEHIINYGIAFLKQTMQSCTKLLP